VFRIVNSSGQAGERLFHLGRDESESGREASAQTGVHLEQRLLTSWNAVRAGGDSVDRLVWESPGRLFRA